MPDFEFDSDDLEFEDAVSKPSGPAKVQPAVKERPKVRVKQTKEAKEARRTKARPKHRAQQEQTVGSYDAPEVSRIVSEAIRVKEDGREYLEYEIRGTSVRFPFEAYATQVVFMERVIATIESGGRHALLESPTGSGKTLCILCATLAYQRSLCAVSKHQQAKYFGGLQNDPNQANRNTPDKRPKDVPCIVFSSRTHSQLKQTLKELQLALGSKRFRYAVLGSRQQFCVNEKVKRGVADGWGDINTLCRAEQMQTAGEKGGSGCRFHRPFQFQKEDELAEHLDNAASALLDIEELGSYGRSRGVCPYYLQRHDLESAHIVLAPYNYIVDPEVRSSVEGLDALLSNAIIIFDEAHNLDSVCGDAASASIGTAEIAQCADELSTVHELLLQQQQQQDAVASVDFVDRETNEKFSRADLEVRARELEKFEDWLVELIERQKKSGSLSEHGNVVYDCTGQEFQQVLRQCGLDTPLVIKRALKCLSACTTMVRDAPTLGRANDSSNALEKWRRLLECALGRRYHSGEQLAGDGTVLHIDMGPRNDPEALVTLNLWCMVPGMALTGIAQRCRNLLLISATLSPLATFCEEFRPLEFEVQLENGHVVDAAKQVRVLVCPTGPGNRRLSSRRVTRQDNATLRDLGNAITQLSHTVPDGMLVFFPSYSMLQQCVSLWDSAGITAQIAQSKSVLREPRASSDLASTYDAFERAIYYPRKFAEVAADTVRADAEHARENVQKPLVPVASADKATGALMYAVARGKVSEGLDFADRNGRAVVIVGLPLPNYGDPRVTQKRAFLDRKQRGLGNEWYQQQALRAVNQSIGRVVRHRGDYASIILLDDRFTEGRTQDAITKWLRPFVRVSPSFPSLLSQVRQFFASVDAVSVRGLEGTLGQVACQRSEKQRQRVARRIAKTLRAGGGGSVHARFNPLRALLQADAWRKLASADDLAAPLRYQPVQVETTSSVFGTDRDLDRRRSVSNVSSFSQSSLDMRPTRSISETLGDVRTPKRRKTLRERVQLAKEQAVQQKQVVQVLSRQQREEQEQQKLEEERRLAETRKQEEQRRAAALQKRRAVAEELRVTLTASNYAQSTRYLVAMKRVNDTAAAAKLVKLLGTLTPVILPLLEDCDKKVRREVRRHYKVLQSQPLPFSKMCRERFSKLQMRRFGQVYARYKELLTRAAPEDDYRDIWHKLGVLFSEGARSDREFNRLVRLMMTEVPLALREHFFNTVREGAPASFLTRVHRLG
ncbi:MAG: hypothetical protein MHM6MM_004075 [Cercozoa sp. M6MM]